MYAVIRTGGKQYKVAAGDIIAVEKLTAEPGSDVTFDQVLMVGDDGSRTVGAPLVDGAMVSATVLDQTKATKIIVFKKKRRKGYRRKAGHRQQQTVVRITDIAARGGKAVKPKAEPAAKVTEAKKPAAKETEPQKPAAKEAAAKPAARKTARKPAAKKPAKETGTAGAEPTAKKTKGAAAEKKSASPRRKSASAKPRAGTSKTGESKE